MLRLSELYTSTQGEGSRTGELTQFVRFAGCNMRCPGWPCDTQHAIDPALYKKGGPNEAELLLPQELAARILVEAQQTGATNICFTGGEPFLQKVDELHQLYQLVRHQPSMESTWEVFTNGSFHLPSWCLNSFQVMMDWKLVSSGEGETALEQRLKNARRLGQNQGIKLVCKDEADLKRASDLIDYLHSAEHDVIATFWLGTAWDTLKEADIVKFMIDNRVKAKLNVQVHKYVWPADERGV